MDILFVSSFEQALKHRSVMNKFDALKSGEAFLLINDHDPKTLYAQLLDERGDIFSWSNLEQGPEYWRVQIKKNDIPVTETVGEIAAKDLRKAEVFRKYGIDFCCGGKKNLRQVCAEKGLDQAIVEAALQDSSHQQSS